MSEDQGDLQNDEAVEASVGADGIPLVGVPELQARLQAIWDEASAHERSAIAMAWYQACCYNDRDRFMRAVTEGKDALLAVEDEIQEDSGGRYSLGDLFWQIEKSEDPDALAARLMAITDQMRGPNRPTVLALLAGFEREATETVVDRHYDVMRWLLVDQPDPDLLPRSALLRDIGADACNMIYCTIEAIWENLDAIEQELRIPKSVPGALETAPRPKCPVCGKRLRRPRTPPAGA